MNIKKSLLALAVATVASSTYAATVTVVLTGSTAFRSIVQDRVPTLLSGLQTVTTASGNTYRTYMGTMASLPGDTVVIKMSFNGSVEGIDALNNSTALTVLPDVTYTGSGTSTATPTASAQGDLAFSDVFPSTAGRSSAKFAGENKLGVVPYVFARAPITSGAGNIAANISNLTQRQASQLYSTAGNTSLSYFTGNAADTDVLYLVGRYSLSGTRATVESVIYNSALYGNWYLDSRDSTPHQFGDDPTYEKGATLQPGGVPAYALDNGGGVSGFVGGGDLKTHLTTFPNAIGYLGIADVGSNVKINYEGVTESQANVASGAYSLWSYEHAYYKTPAQSGPTGSKLTVVTAIINAIKSNAYQTDNTKVYFTTGFVPLSTMTVERNVDGGPISPL
ncbi:MAG TPA: hypothetical protein VMF06_12150 [Candidatus Limnocylindria bacterium]|nr:hypothetical protein [Candidatus Limnocylindria bacterium]